MAYTFLDAVNATLKDVKIVSGVSGELTSFTNSALQQYIDTAIRVWNEVLHEVYSNTEQPYPLDSETAVLTLTDGIREYPLPTDLEMLRYPLINEGDGHRILEYPGGFQAMRNEQLQPDNFTGQPNWATINPTNGLLRLDTTPTMDNDGDQFTILYDHRLQLVSEPDTFPFSDTVVDSLVPVSSELWKRGQQRTSDDALMALSMARAMRYLSQSPMRRSW